MHGSEKSFGHHFVVMFGVIAIAAMALLALGTHTG